MQEFKKERLVLQNLQWPQGKDSFSHMGKGAMKYAHLGNGMHGCYVQATMVLVVPQRYIQSRISKHKALKTQASAERKNNKENMMYVCFPSAVFLYDHYEVKV